MLKDKRFILPFVVIGCAILIFVGFMSLKKKPERKPEERQAPFVSVQPVKLQTLTLSVRSQGLVAPKYKTDLLAQVSGEITYVADTFVRGGLVEKGELLAQIDPFNYEVKLEQAKANLASARAAFILERAQGRVAEAEWEKITTAQPSELGLRKPQQEQALAAVKAAEAGLKQASKDLERTKIIAPFDALIGMRSISPGTFVNIGTPLGHVMDISTAEVRLPVASGDILFLQNGGVNASATLTATIAGKVFQWQATIDRDEGVVDDNNRMLYLVARLQDPYNQRNSNAQRLAFGTYVTAEIQGKQISNATRVPRQLLRNNQLPVFENEQLSFVDVDVVRHQGKHTVVTGGLSNGDLLITSSLQHPVEGMALAADVAPNSEQPLTTAEPVETANTES